MTFYILLLKVQTFNSGMMGSLLSVASGDTIDTDALSPSWLSLFHSSHLLEERGPKNFVIRSYVIECLC